MTLSADRRTRLLPRCCQLVAGLSAQLWDDDALIDVALTPAFEPERARDDELRAPLLDAYHGAMTEVTVLGRRWRDQLQNRPNRRPHTVGVYPIGRP